MVMLGTTLGRILLDRPAWTYLLGPFFKASTPDQAAPLSATYREAGAVGALTVTDTESKITVSGGRAIISGGKAAPGYGDPGWRGASVTRTAGMAVLFTLQRGDSSHYGMIGWSYAASGQSMQEGFGIGATVEVVYANNSGLAFQSVIATNVDNDYASVLRSRGAFDLIKIAGVWTLLYVSATQNTATLYPAVADYSMPLQIANFRVVPQLGGAWASDYGIATSHASNPPNGQTYTRTTDALVEFTFAWAGSNVQLHVRYSDGNNRWILRANSSNALELVEVNAGVVTVRATYAVTWTLAQTYRVVLVNESNVFTAYLDNVQRLSYTDPGSFLATNTTVQVGTAGVSEIVAWPRTVSLPNGV